MGYAEGGDVNRMTMLTCGWFVAMSAVATGCADTSDGTDRGVDTTVETTETSRLASGLTQQGVVRPG